MEIQKFVANLSKKVQKKTLAGKEYLVAPVSMLVEGVFVGNQGAIFYGEDELSKYVQSWNHRPITISHPEDAAGNKISGCTPEALEATGVGMILNASWQEKNKKLVAKAYFDVNRLDTVVGGQKIKEALEKELPLEVSTGLFVDNEAAAGEYNGKKYEKIAKNFKPDHLAVILYGTGACSIADGAGLLVNKNGEKPTINPRLLVNAEMSLTKLISEVEKAVRETHENGVDPVTGVHDWVYVEEIYEDKIIFGKNGNWYSESFTHEDGKVKLLGNLIQVTREVSYKPISLVTNAKVNMDKTELIASLGEAHKAFVEAMTDEQVAALAKYKTDLVANAKAEVVPAEPAKPKTIAEVLEICPADIQASINEALTTNAASRKSLIEVIVANKQNTFTEAELESFSTVSLNKMAGLVVNAKSEKNDPIFAGGAGQPAPAVVEGFLPPSTLSK